MTDHARIISRTCFFAVLAALVLAPALAPAQDESSEMFGTNLSFEQGTAGKMPSGWSGDTNFFSYEKGEGRNGTAALRLTADGQAYPIASQRLDVVPGTKLQYSCYARVQELEGGEAKIAIEWYAHDKYAGGSYSTGFIDDEDGGEAGAADGAGWKKIGGTAMVPLDVDRVTLLCYISQGGKGTVFFDDCQVKEAAVTPFYGITSDHYRHIADGKDRGGVLTIRVGVAAGRVVASPKDAAFEMVITPAGAGEPGESGEALMKVEPTSFGEDYIDYAVPTAELPPGKYTAAVTAVLPRKSGEGTFESRISLDFTRVEAYPERRAYIDQYRRLILDGEPFFPLGCYFGDVKPEELETFADSPFNCLMPYHSISRETLDLCQEKNIKVIYSVKDNYRTLSVGSDEEGNERTRRTVEDLKDHPAIIAWYINDELPQTMMRQLTARRDQMEALDPGRPTWVVLYQVNEIRDYIPTFDVIGTDPYPIPSQPASAAGDAAVKTYRGALGLHALWQVPQIFDWASYKKTDEEKKAHRAPTFEEVRGMFWMQIAAGANGLVAYSWFDLLRMDKTTAEGGHAYVREPFDQRWAEVKTAAGEVARYFPVLLAVDPAIEAKVTDEQAAKDTIVRLYGHEGKTWMLIVNRLDQPRTVPFEASEAESAEVQLGGTLASFEGGKGTVELAPLEPCFVVLTPKK